MTNRYYQLVDRVIRMIDEGKFGKYNIGVVVWVPFLTNDCEAYKVIRVLSDAFELPEGLYCKGDYEPFIRRLIAKGVVGIGTDQMLLDQLNTLAKDKTNNVDNFSLVYEELSRRGVVLYTKFKIKE